MLRGSNGWTVVKVAPEQMTMIYLDDKLDHILYDSSNIKHPDMIVRIASTAGLTFITKHIDSEGMHVYIFVGSERVNIKQGYMVLQFLHRYNVHVSGVVTAMGSSCEMFLTGDKVKSREFYYKSVYGENFDNREMLLGLQEMQEIMKDLTPQVLYPLLTHDDNKLLAWFINLPVD